jgi:uncharacterized protein (DUF3820 family)
MNSDIKLKFGKHKGTMLKDVPSSYLKWCVDEKVIKGRAMLYAKQKLNYPKDKYKVEVEDAVIGDGIYYVEAYNRYDAIRQVKKENHIQITQSFYGTSFCATKL